MHTDEQLNELKAENAKLRALAKSIVVGLDLSDPIHDDEPVQVSIGKLLKLRAEIERGKDAD